MISKGKTKRIVNHLQLQNDYDLIPLRLVLPCLVAKTVFYLFATQVI